MRCLTRWLAALVTLIALMLPGTAAAQSSETLLDRLRPVPGLTVEERPASAPYRCLVVGAGYIPGTVDA